MSIIFPNFLQVLFPFWWLYEIYIGWIVAHATRSIRGDKRKCIFEWPNTNGKATKHRNWGYITEMNCERDEKRIELLASYMTQTKDWPQTNSWLSLRNEMRAAKNWHWKQTKCKLDYWNKWLLNNRNISLCYRGFGDGNKANTFKSRAGHIQLKMAQIDF